MKRMLVALISGLLFGLGLSISEMVNPKKVLSFLDVSGAWDPSLILVLGAGLIITFISFRLIPKMEHPLLDKKFRLPTKTKIDSKLVSGAIIFGTGWGLVGYCPGPAIASLAYGQTESVIFLVALFLGPNVDRLYRRPTTII